MTMDEIALQLTHLENQYEDASARLMIAEALLSSIVRHLPQAATVIDDFKDHQDYLMAAALNSSDTSDARITKLQAAREVMLYRLGMNETQSVPGSTR